MNERKEHSIRINPKLVRRVVPLFVGVLLTGAEVIAANNARAANNLNLQPQVYFPSIEVGEMVNYPTPYPTPPPPCIFINGVKFCGGDPTSTPTEAPIDPNCNVDPYGNKICSNGNTRIDPSPISITVGTTVSGSPVPLQ